MYKYSKELIVRQETTYTVLPSYIDAKVKIYLDSIGISYKELVPKDFPDGVCGYDFLGEQGIIDAVAFETHIDSGQLHEIATELAEIVDPRDIAGAEFAEKYDSIIL